MIDYIKRNLLHPLSFFGVFFIILALFFGASTMYKCSQNAKIKRDRVKITGTIANASEVTIKKRYSKRGNGIQRYLQDLDISYDYHNKNYTKSYKQLNVGKPNGYHTGDKVSVYADKNTPSDAILSSLLFTDTVGTKQLLILFAIPGVIIILFPKKWLGT